MRAQLNFKNWPDDSITVNKRELSVKVGTIAHADLKFYFETPRLYTLVYSAGMSQDEIQNKLIGMDHVKQLIQSIKSNGGLTDPLLIALIKAEHVVIEGNSRLAAYRALSLADPVRWASVKCRILVNEISEDDIFALLGEYHIIGRKDWGPYEQAGYLFRRHFQQDASVDKISSELGLSKKEISHLICTYDFMSTKGENEPDRWSYYDSYFRCSKVRTFRETNPEIDDLIVSKIRNLEIETARDLRDKLPVILSANKKTRDNFFKSNVDFESSYDRAVTQGADNSIYKRLSRYRQWIAEATTISKALNNLPENQRNRCVFEIKKTLQSCRTIMKKFE